MVINKTDLNLVFGALADPIRRGILVSLADGEANVRTLAAPHDISQPAVSRHLRVLEKAGLIAREQVGREHRIRVKPEPLCEARGWIGHYARFWSRHFDAVDELLKQSRRTKTRDED